MALGSITSMHICACRAGFGEVSGLALLSCQTCASSSLSYLSALRPVNLALVDARTCKDLQRPAGTRNDLQGPARTCYSLSHLRRVWRAGRLVS